MLEGSTLLSTKAVAGLLNVAETTVKRWADGEALPCVKTPGGHRKFLMKEVLAFAERHRYPLTGLLPPRAPQERQEELNVGVLTRDFPLLSRIFLDEALLGNRDGLYEMLTYLYTHRISLPVLADDLVRTSMKEVGRRWREGMLEVNQEHQVSQAVLEALLRFGPVVHQKHRNGLTAVLACVEGEWHSIGLQCVRYALEAEGWTVHMLGANTPFDTLRSMVKRVQPALVGLSVAPSRRVSEIRGPVGSLTRLVHAWKGVVVMGGGLVGELRPGSLNGDFLAPSLQDAIDFARDRFQLKPGPKPSRSASRSPK